MVRLGDIYQINSFSFFFFPHGIQVYQTMMMILSFPSFILETSIIKQAIEYLGPLILFKGTWYHYVIHET